QGSEQGGPGPFRPLAVDGGGVAGRYFIEARKSPEVVETDHVEHIEPATEASNPPCVSALRVRVPAIDGIAPELAGGAEVIRWHTCDHFRLAAFVELEQSAIGPDIGAVECDVDRHVAQDANAVSPAVGFQVVPLPLEFKLDELVTFDLFTQFVARPFDGSGLTQRQFAAPLRPHHVLVRFLEGHEQRELIEPSDMFLAERLVPLTVRWRAPLERLKSLAQQR